VASLAGADIAFKKIDSLLRGPALAELAAVMRTGTWQHCVFAPAFPYQGRATRDGRQWARDVAGTWRDVSGDLARELRTLGVAAHRCRPGDAFSGVAVFDAETDDDLARIVQSVESRAVLWCGTGGLARALAGPAAAQVAPLPRPVLGLFGSDQPATAAQLDACEPYRVRLAHDHPGPAAALAGREIALVSLDLPPGLLREQAAGHIDAGFAALLRDLPRPGTLVAAGGETLRGICATLGATHLEVQGCIEPGLPRSVLRGGRWDGVCVVSKSGAFGPPSLLHDLLHHRLAERSAT
jgi:uncharacterized protein YgbK (DUF1537 family)